MVLLHYKPVALKVGCNVYREGLGTRMVAVISIGRVCGPPGRLMPIGGVLRPSDDYGDYQKSEDHLGGCDI